MGYLVWGLRIVIAAVLHVGIRFALHDNDVELTTFQGVSVFFLIYYTVVAGTPWDPDR